MAAHVHDFASKDLQGALDLPDIPSPGGQGSGSRTPVTSKISERNGILVFSGGSAANNLVEIFNQLRESNNTSLSYVVPISDNGGSSSELIRVFGGPGIGDIRSRLIRLIPTSTAELVAIKAFFNHRLPPTYAPARMEWLDILETNHPLWTNISSPKRELIRSFLNSINLEMLKRLRPSSRFDFSGASIGNLFLTGARLFTGSFEAAIYLLSSICAVPDTVAVLPVLNTNFAHHIAAGLTDGTIITGQNNISHPSVPTQAVPQNPGRNSLSQASPAKLLKRETEEQDKVEDANLPGTLPTLRKPAIVFSKEDEEDLPARIERLWYINPYGHEITLPANPRVIDAINSAGYVIYSIGSLFTSIIPSLILKGVGEALASPWIKSKILILNGSVDRETGPSDNPFTAVDFVRAIANACAESRGWTVPVREDCFCRYVTHVVYLEGVGSPKADSWRLGELGIEVMRVYGPGGERGRGRYDLRGLEQALEALIGVKDARSDRTRRNTFVG